MTLNLMAESILKRLLGSALALVVTFTAAGDAWGADCADDLGASSFARINSSLLNNKKSLQPGTMKMGMSVAKDDVTAFWTSTFPYLRGMAQAHEVTVAELVGEFLTLRELIGEGFENTEGLEIMKAYHRQLLHGFETLQALPPGAKMKAKEWETVTKVYLGLVSISYFAYGMEILRRSTPSYDPLLPLTRAQVEKIFDSLEDMTLDHASRAIALWSTRRQRVAEFNSRRESTVLPPEAEQAVVEEEKSIQAALADSTDLAIVLLERLPLRAGTEYDARTSFGDDLKVTLSEGLVQDSKGAENRAVTRLLRSILTGRGSKSGIKALFDIGPHIVELKAVMHGHKRIFGCLEGRTLRLKKLLDIKDTRTTYFHRIPSGFCAD